MHFPALLSTFAVALLAGAPAAVRAEIDWANAPEVVPFGLDLVNSTVGFTVRLAGVAVKGEFVKFGGTIRFDAKNPERTRIQAKIETASINTGNERRDRHLRSRDYFDAELFPTMTFQGTRIQALPGGNFELTGDLTIKQVTKSVILQVHPFPPEADRLGRWEATTQLRRKDFGITNSSFADHAIGDLVEISLHIETTVLL